MFFIVDEAHHSTAKTYRRVIDHVGSKVRNLKLIGLTATPFRTAADEQGLLGKIYTDGIVYQINLKDLISRKILSRPIFESYYTDGVYGAMLGLDALERIQQLDTLPDDIADQMAVSAVRNKLIVDAYCKKREVYQQTLVFAINIAHAVHLSTMFKDAGIKADFIVSELKDSTTGTAYGSADNERKLNAYRKGELQVLINVNILTEGVDLPQTQTVFLARPTVSTILMTQMIGRALRGTEAGGTPEAYVVSFIDNWNEHISWVNPESLFYGDNEFVDTPAGRSKRALRMINFAKLRGFSAILNNAIDTTALEKVSFIRRIPLGMYDFSYLEESGVDHSHQIMVYSSTAEAYQKLMDALPALFQGFGVEDEYLLDETLVEMEQVCRDTFFCGEMVPSYEPHDVISIL